MNWMFGLGVISSLLGLIYEIVDGGEHKLGWILMMFLWIIVWIVWFVLLSMGADV